MEIRRSPNFKLKFLNEINELNQFEIRVEQYVELLIGFLERIIKLQLYGAF